MSWLTEPVPGEENHVPVPQPIMFDPLMEHGCLIDERHGAIQGGIMAISQAQARNWQGLNAEDRAVVERVRTGTEEESDGTVFDEIVDEATAFLDEECCPPGWSVQWHEGNLMLSTVEDWCEASGDRCDDASHVHPARTP